MSGSTPPGPTPPGTNPPDPTPPGSNPPDPWSSQPPSPYRATPPSPYGGGPATYGPASGPPVPSPPPSKGVAITAFVLALLPCIPFAVLISPVLAIVALVRSRKGGDHGSGWAIAALGVLAAWIVLGAVLLATDSGLFEDLRDGTTAEAPRDSTGAVTESTDISPSDLETGDCLIDRGLLGTTPEAETKSVVIQVLPCSQPHVAEVFYDFELADGAYPGDAAVDREAGRACVEKFKDFVGRGYRTSKLELFYYLPRERSWNLLEDRLVTCMVSERTDTTVGSLANARR